MTQCSATTRKGAPCPFNADRNRNGEWFCHLHDPMGTYQLQHTRHAATLTAGPRRKVTRQIPTLGGGWIAPAYNVTDEEWQEIVARCKA